MASGSARWNGHWSCCQAACPETDAEALAALSIGERDALLLRLRHWTFGALLTGAADCFQCGEPIGSCSTRRLPPAGPVTEIAVTV